MKLLLAILLCFPMLCFSESKANAPALVLGFVPSRNSHEIQLSSKLIADYLSKQTGYTIKAVTLANYAGVVVGMKTGKVDFAFVGPVNYLVIDKVVGAVPLTSAVRHGQPSYKSIIIARKDSGINSIEDLKGKSIAVGDNLSASSSLYPRDAIMQRGLIGDKSPKYIHIGSQSSIAISVAMGKVDAGAMYIDARMNPEVLKARADILDETKIIYTSPDIPGDPQIARSNLPSEQIYELRIALLKLGSDPVAKQWMKDIYGIDSLTPAQKSDYSELAALVNRLDPDLLNDDSVAAQ